jgi:hypothetical protein
MKKSIQTKFVKRVGLVILFGITIPLYQNCSGGFRSISGPEQSLSSGSVGTAGILDLGWNDNSSDETGFEIQRRELESTSFTQIATVGANTSTYRDMNLILGKSYCYRIKAFNGNGGSSPTNEACAVARR